MIILFTKHEDVGSDDAPYLTVEAPADVPLNEGVKYYSYVAKRDDGIKLDGDLAPEVLQKTLSEFEQQGFQYAMVYEHKD